MTIDMDYYRKINGMFGTVSKIDYLQKQATKSVNKAHSHVLSTFEILVNSDKAEDIVVDNTTNTKCIFDYSKTSKDTKTELASYTKEMWIEVGIISVGSVVKHTDKVSLIENTYIVVSKQEDSNGYDLCYIQRCNNTLQFYDSSSTLHSIPCIISKGSISLDEQKIISTLDSEIAVQISNTSITRQIKINDIYRIGIRNYYVTDINDITIPGLLLLKMVYSEVSQETHTFILTILNGSSLSIQQDNTLQLNVNVTDNGVLLVNPTITYLSSNNLICTVNSSGLVSSVGIGSCSIGASANGVSEDIVIEVIAEEQQNYTVEVSGSTSIIKSYTKEYLAVFKNNGLPIVKESSFWLTGVDNLPTSLAIITSQNVVNNTCVVRGDTLGSVKLWCKSTDDSIVSQDGIVIQIKSLF